MRRRLLSRCIFVFGRLTCAVPPRSAKHLNSPDEVLHAAAGSIGYAAPEVLTNAGHGKPVDLWSLGIITFVLLCGYSPFRSDDANELMEETVRGRIEFHERYWKSASARLCFKLQGRAPC